MKIGVLALQGDFIEHIALLKELGVEAHQIRLPEQLTRVDGVIIPGGESTTLSRLMNVYHFREPIISMARQGKPIWGTCAGMIMLAHEITEADPVPLQLIDIGVHRNAFGRQIDSFEQDLSITGLSDKPFHAIFIRAPVVFRVGDGVNILSTLEDGRPVAVRQGNLLATAFHPELTRDTRMHAYFLGLTTSMEPPPGQ